MRCVRSRPVAEIGLAGHGESRQKVRKAIASVDSSLVVNGVDPYGQVVSADFQQQKMTATLTSLFGLLGLVLAAVGLYGVMAYTVEQRTNEIGLRRVVSRRIGKVRSGFKQGSR